MEVWYLPATARKPDFRTVIRLRDLDRLGSAEPAVRLGVPGAAVTVRLHRARQAPRVMLEPVFGGP